MLGEFGEEGDFGQGMPIVAKQPLGKIAARLLGQGVLAHPVVGQTPMKRTPVEPKAARDLCYLQAALTQRFRDGVPGLAHHFGGV